MGIGGRWAASRTRTVAASAAFANCPLLLQLVIGVTSCFNSPGGGASGLYSTVAQIQRFIF
jgi:hypothetical protein